MEAIEILNVSKQFRVYYDKGNTLKEKVLFRERNYYENHEVLKDITIKIRKGESIGLIGQNGCGKSTLLKIINRIMYPNKGKINVNGRVSSLIELGAGFHPDLSGRENIFTNASIFGLKKNEIQKRLKQIIEFSELGKYIDNPVRTYSSGMYMRLAFSVAINVDADILLIDEILAVGDVAFQAKCFDRLKEFKKQGKTIVIVSHSLGQIEQLCDRSIWILDGQIEMEGRPMDVHPKYLEYMGKVDRSSAVEVSSENEEISGVNMRHPIANSKKRWGNGDIIFTNVQMLNGERKPTLNFITGEPFIIHAEYKMMKKIEKPVFGIGIWDMEGSRCYGTNTQMDFFETTFPQTGIVEFLSDNLSLLNGKYQLEVAVVDENGLPFDFWHEAMYFKVFSTINDLGVMRIQHRWNVRQ